MFIFSVTNMAFANDDESKETTENTTDVSKNPITGTKTVTETKRHKVAQGDMKRSETHKVKRKYNKDGSKMSETRETETEK